MIRAVRRWFAVLGPGLITGASDDDPSGISTYSIAGASAGFSMLWIVLLITPMASVIQGMCARFGLQRGVGLATLMKRRLPVWIVLPLGAAVVIANTINAGADLEGMAAAARLVIPFNQVLFVLIFAALLIVMQVFFSYRLFANVVKWLAVALFAYVITAFVVHPHWGTVLHNLFIPTVKLSGDWVTTALGVLGTTITPYLFFYQSALEVEEEKSEGKSSERQRVGATPQEVRARHLDVNSGMIFSNVVACFIIVTTAATLGAAGRHDIASAADAARALAPLAGRFASALFALGMVGTGLLAIPALTASSAYVAAETLGFRYGLGRKPARAPRYYGVLVGGIAVATLMGVFRVDPIGALFWSAVINGIVAVPLLAIIVSFSSNARLMHECVASPAARAWGWAATVLMAAVAIVSIGTWIKW